jgi:hypothetical protein
VITRFASEPKSNNDSGAERPRWADYEDFEVDVDDIVDGDFKDEKILTSLVDAMLIKMGFPRTVIDFTSCQFSININGELAGNFQGGRGLRQGDPLSPYLFVLCMEILSGLFCKMSAIQNFKFHWRCKKENISHLCFADDVMIFSKGDVNSIRMIRTVLTEFQDLSSLYPNPNKSDIFLSGALNAEREQIIRILGFREGELPMKYLGVPLTSSRLKVVYCKGLVDRITSKVRHWTCRTLSYAGRVQLINSVLFSIQVYWASLFLLPGQVIKIYEANYEILSLVRFIYENYWG